MNKNEAKKLIEYVFTHKFQPEYFERFISNIFKDYKPLDISREGQSIKDAFKPHVAKYKIIGSFSDAENNDIDILFVALNNIKTLQRARTLQRNFVADYLNSNGKEAALVAFITNKDEWRFSLVKLDHSLEVVDEKIKTKKEITPARRWSFLVGKNEGSHTAQSRFIKLLTNNEKPNLAELESAFNIESVTKEFFDRYTQLYFGLKEHLDSLVKSDEKIKKDFEEKEISTVDFAKKTLGQIVFLYFLQKKGWFGVAADKDWGSGPKNFLRELFARRENYGKNFFNDILEPLFYEALAQDRGEDAIYTKLNNVRMPFLNGGLFEPMNNYQWEMTDIVIPDELFSNDVTDTKTGDVGNGILDVFDRYNFTVNENEPLEQEVAVDPEMLGKVFENLLEIKDRKSKGAFYTPREIVHYMCQETLINYLETETTDISRDDIEFFIRQGELILENDKTTAGKIAEKEDKGYEYKGDYSYLLPQSIIDHASDIDKLLYDIKVADPAVGSGAFPLGMLNEIVRARRVIGVHIKDNKKVYTLKKETISNSLYGVDIDPGAVEIAKLRLWLSLVVDENKPHPLPNLDHKIMQGNSLISEYEGIKLFDDSIFGTVNEKDSQVQEIENRIKEIGRETISLAEQNIYSGEKIEELEKEAKSLKRKLTNLNKKDIENPAFQSLFDEPEQINLLEQKTQELTEKTAQYISESGRSGKQSLKRDIDQLKWEIIEMTLKQQGREDKIEELDKMRRKNIKPFFIWKLEFADVFKNRGGFDAVIGNPPYVSVKDISLDDKKYFSEKFKSGSGRFNLFTLFFENGHSLLKDAGTLSYIVPDGIYTNVEYRHIREFILNEAKILYSVLFDYRVFTASVDTSILSFSKVKSDENSSFNVYRNLKQFNSTINQKDLFKTPFNLFPVNIRSSHKTIFDKLSSSVNTIEDILEIQQGIIYSGQKKEDIFSNEKKDDSFKKVLDGRDVLKWNINWDSKKDNKFISYTKKLHRPRDERIFLVSEKLLLPRKATKISCGYDDKQFYALNTAYVMLLKNQNFNLKFILAFLNSKLINFYYSSLFFGWQVTIPALNSIKVPNLQKEDQKSFVGVVNQILEITSDSDYDPKNPPERQIQLEAKIDEMVMDLYKLTEEEKEVVRNS